MNDTVLDIKARMMKSVKEAITTVLEDYIDESVDKVTCVFPRRCIRCRPQGGLPHYPRQGL